MINYKLIKGVAKSTDEIEQDFVYFCFKGIKIDGHEFIDAAFLKGAKYVIGTKKFGELENYFVIDDIEEEFKKASYNVYHFNLNKISSIGITGTNGKTSTAIILDQLLNKFDSCAYIGTSGFTIKQKKVNYNGMTTPFCNILYKNMEEITNQRCNYLAIEISSHALVQNRIGNLELDFAIFTNLSKEHLDFHKNMENYFESKKKIISHLSPNGKLIVNSDDEFGKRIKSKNIITFGENIKANYIISDIVCYVNGTTFTLSFKGNKYNIKTNLLAKFNVYNLVGAMIVLIEKGININFIIKELNTLNIPGRMEVIQSKKSGTIILDFAHSGDSIKEIMKFIKPLKNGKLYTITGSAGERDKTKRAEMGKYAASIADCLILTEDDPRSESVKEINKDIEKGIENKKCEVIEIIDRIEAIKYALNKSSKNDIIMILGKAGQDLMYYQEKTIEFIEREIVKDIIINLERGYHERN